MKIENNGALRDQSAPGAAKEIIGPFLIRQDEWPLGLFLVVEAIACDDANRIYAVGYIRRTSEPEFFLVRISAEGTVSGGLADLDLTFGDNGFVPVVIGVNVQILGSGQSEIIALTATHLVVSVEVVNGTLHETALCRYLIDGQVDNSFGVDGVLRFSQLPEPPPWPKAVYLSAGLSTPVTTDATEQLASLGRSVNALSAQVYNCGQSAVNVFTGRRVLAQGQILLVVHRRRIVAGEKFSFLIRVNDDGTIDTSYAGGVGFVRLSFAGSSEYTDYHCAVDSNERALIASETEDWQRCIVARYSPDGTLDPAFGQFGFIQISSSTGAVRRPSVAVDGNDRALLGLTYDDVNSNHNRIVYLYRLSDDGSADSEFNNGNPIELTGDPFQRNFRVEHIVADELQRILLRIGVWDGTRNSGRISRCTDLGLDTSFGDAGSFVLNGRGGMGNIAIQKETAVVTFDSAELWRLLL